MELFAEASRRKLRFETPQGQLSVEELWDLPLTSGRVARANLDAIAVDLNKQLQSVGTDTFVRRPGTPRANEVLKLKFDIVLQVIDIRQTEADAEGTARANAEKKQQMLAMIANKENEALSSKSVEELRAMVATL